MVLSRICGTVILIIIRWIVKESKTSQGLSDWLKRLGLPVTGNRKEDILTKRKYDAEKMVGKLRG